MDGETRGENGGRLLAEQFLARPRLAAAVERLIDDAEEDIRRLGYGDIVIRQKSRLHALQLFDHAVRRDPGAAYQREDYRQAADIVREAGYPKRALILDEFGDIVDNAHLLEYDVEPFHKRWAARHAAWAQAASGRDQASQQMAAGLVREHGRAWRGVDGAIYTKADCAGPLGVRWPAVIVRNGAGLTETVMFDDRAVAAAWLADRTRGGTGPLLTNVGGLAYRATREEQVLARLIRDPHDDQLRILAGVLTWTSHLRAELHAATLPGYFVPHPDLRQTRHSLEHQLLRAPGWELGLIGWPDAPRAMRYLDRLAETPVTAAQAHAAGQALAAVGMIPGAAAVAAAEARRRVPGQARRTLEGGAPHRYASRSGPVLVPPPSLPGSGGLVPRR